MSRDKFSNDYSNSRNRLIHSQSNSYKICGTPNGDVLDITVKLVKYITFIPWARFPIREDVLLWASKGVKSCQEIWARATVAHNCVPSDSTTLVVTLFTDILVVLKTGSNSQREMESLMGAWLDCYILVGYTRCLAGRGHATWKFSVRDN